MLNEMKKLISPSCRAAFTIRHVPRAQKIWGRQNLCTEKKRKRKMRALRIYLTIPVTNCTAERSFSALKRVKTDTRTTMQNEKLNSLMLLCTQNDITLALDYDDVINDFAMIKARKKPLLKYIDNESKEEEDV
uniref:HAT C-terminal dimerisation domain-containing protein n=1 Tax=Cacopsylla melanoneura TaxID=428564 RepID=A0A8D8Q8V9_9HEMI